MKIGRNDPCPCGSGLKYKKCCADKTQDGAEPTGAGAGAAMDELKKILQGQNFGSLEEANAFVGRFMQQRNEAPVVDFHGLSSEQMHRMLNFPFETPGLATLTSPLPAAPQAPISALCNLLVEAIGEQGVKATATGNLPRTLCREAALAYWGEEKYRHETRFGEIRTEPDFGELHVTRLVAEFAGVIRKYKGKFIIGGECRKILAVKGQAGIYPRLFKAYVNEYNWGYRDRMGEVPFIQQSILFSLYLLSKYGGDWKSNTFYEDCFLEAFPQLISQVPPMGQFYSPEEVLRRTYSLRCLDRFATFLGLVELERPGNESYSEGFQLRKLPLLDQVVQFHL
jgi:hypothetical protein